MHGYRISGMTQIMQGTCTSQRRPLFCVVFIFLVSHTLWCSFLLRFCLTHCSVVTTYLASSIWGSIGSIGNDLWPDGTKPLPTLMLTRDFRHHPNAISQKMRRIYLQILLGLCNTLTTFVIFNKKW